MKEINQENRLPDEKELRQENLSRVKKADRKALPKFLLILLIAHRSFSGRRPSEETPGAAAKG